MRNQTSERPMRNIREEMYSDKTPTPKQQEAINQVWAMAKELVTLPERSHPFYLSEIRTHTNGRQRWLATRFTPPEHEAFGPLMAMLDALIADSGVSRTKQGAFTEDDLKDVEAMIVREDGKEMVLFPVRYPWKEKPNPEKGEDGKRLPAMYRSKDDRGPRKDSFRVVPRPTIDDKDWWDE